MLDQTVAIKCVSKYASKPETPSDSYLQALTTFCNRLPRHLLAERAVQSLFAKMAADRDISADAPSPRYMRERATWSGRVREVAVPLVRCARKRLA